MLKRGLERIIRFNCIGLGFGCGWIFKKEDNIIGNLGDFEIDI